VNHTQLNSTKNMTTKLPQLQTVKEAASLLRISPRHLHALTKSKALASIKLGKSVRYSMDALNEFIASHTRDSRK